MPGRVSKAQLQRACQQGMAKFKLVVLGSIRPRPGMKNPRRLHGMANASIKRVTKGFLDTEKQRLKVLRAPQGGAGRKRGSMTQAGAQARFKKLRPAKLRPASLPNLHKMTVSVKDPVADPAGAASEIPAKNAAAAAADPNTFCDSPTDVVSGASFMLDPLDVLDAPGVDCDMDALWKEFEKSGVAEAAAQNLGGVLNFMA